MGKKICRDWGTTKEKLKEGRNWLKGSRGGMQTLVRRQVEKKNQRRDRRRRKDREQKEETNLMERREEVKKN
jgi:hypothetical protein